MQNLPHEPVESLLDLDQDKRVELAMTDIAAAAREGLLAMSVAIGMAVMHELMDDEAAMLAGPKGKHDPDRHTYRHGYERSGVVLGARRLKIKRPRLRRKRGGEVELTTHTHFASRDLLNKSMFERIVAGVSMRRLKGTGEPVGHEVDAKAMSTSKSATSREFVKRTREALGQLMSRSLADVRLAALMIDGIDLKGRTNIVALGVTTDGVKLPLGLWEGSTENATVATALLSNLVDRGLDPQQGMLFVIDGGKALRKAIHNVFGHNATIQRCVRHKERNLLDHLPDSEKGKAKARMRAAWAMNDADAAKAKLMKLRDELGFAYPGAAASLDEGMDETLTIQRLGITGPLRTTLQSTNPIESMISITRTISRNVKNWQSGDMSLRWTAAGMLEAEKQFKRVAGYNDLAKLALAVEREHAVIAATVPVTATEATADTLAAV